MDPNEMDGDTMINAAKGIQGKTQDSLNRTKYMVEQSKEVGQSIASELQKQSQQIKDVTEEMMTIEDKLKRADRVCTHCFSRTSALSYPQTRAHSLLPSLSKYSPRI
jgi:septal ring factor EnvC (AmiA/AmiB activator)